MVDYLRAALLDLRAVGEGALVGRGLVRATVEIPHDRDDLDALAAVEPDLGFADVDRELPLALVPAVELEVRDELVAAALDEVRAVDVAAARGQAALDRAEHLEHLVPEREAGEVGRNRPSQAPGESRRGATPRLAGLYR